MEVLDILIEILLIEILSDSDWHSINEISTHPKLKNYSITDLGMVLNLLAEYNFIELEQNPNAVTQAKLTKNMMKFLRKIRWLEKIER